MDSSLVLAPLPPGQFRIFPSHSPNIDLSSSSGAQFIRFSDLVVEYDKLLRATLIDNDKGAMIGVILGNAFIIDSGERLSSKHFSEFCDAHDQVSAFERLYETLFGCFAIILIISGRNYLYLDACGCLSAVYAPDLKIVGATALAILTPAHYNARFLRDLYSRLDVAHEGWFPSGLTAHRNVHRLLCNHRIDLNSFLVNRHWPNYAPIRAEKIRGTIQTIADTAREALLLILNNFNAALALTGGSDSRCLLSLLRPRPPNLVTYVIDAKNPTSDVDVYLSKKIARLGGLTHNVLPLVPTANEVIQQWHLRCGHAIGGTNAHIHTSLAQLEGVEAIVEGFGGEVAKGFFWKKSDYAEMPITARMLCGRFGLPIASEVVNATQTWLANTPPGDAFFKLDLAYLELRMSAWAYAQSYVDPPLLHLSPLISRRSFEAMFQLPIDSKRCGALTNELIRGNWSELNRIPFNKYGDVRDVFRLTRKAANLSRLKKKLRKLAS